MAAEPCKLTVIVPVDLRRRARSVAAMRGEHVTDVVVRALQEYVAEALEQADDVRAVIDFEQRLARGEEGFEDWTKVREELGALPD